MSRNNGSVVFVGRKNVVAVALVSVFNHFKQRFILRFAVDIPAGVKDFMTAVLEVGLSKHHQLDVCGVCALGSGSC